MDTYEITNLLLTKLKSLDPENAARIMGFILIQVPSEKDLLRLAFGPETLLQNVVFKAKTHFGLSTSTFSTPSTPSSPLPLNPIARPCNNTNPFSQSSPRVANNGSFLDFGKNPPPNPWPVHGLPNNSNGNTSISPKSSPFLSYDNIRSGSALVPPSFSTNGGNGGGDCSNNSVDFPDEYRLDDYLSFLDDSTSKNEGFMDQGAQLGGYPVANGDSHLHRRRFSESDAYFGAEDGVFGLGYKPCLYFARGFCKNGESCKFVHGGENMAEVNGGNILLSSPREMEELYLQQQEEMMRMKAAQQQQQRRLAYNKYMNFLLQQQNKTERLGAAAAMMGDEFYNLGRLRGGRNDFFAMGMAGKANSASRQIYLTFPADSSFKDEDVSNYFSSFGPVQDVRIPYQQKRMFGFVTFVHPETVKEILAKGNPHYICESRVLVKPYKEKGKEANKMQQLLERGDFSPTSSPSGFDPRELRDLHLGAKMLYNTPEIMLRRRLEEQAELQQAIELQGRRLINLQLPDLRGDHAHHHHRSLSGGAPISLHTHHALINQTDTLTSDGKNEFATEDNGNFSGPTKSTYIAAIEQNLQDDVNAVYIQNNGTVNCKLESFTESHGRNVEPDVLSKSSENQHLDLFPCAEVKESNELSVASWSEKDASVPTTSTSDEASH
ncbi:ZINC FINGER CCCH DOMAIN-CONTAINING PROTEIN 55 [Salix viminalis]|uniref:ZINC FINGER CCCH DOMAIN-CONTAINING PROTEIN 55 n=1 Tax=Salix viminalis TaxID=40686 RepID=A0A9Q0NJI5_SALVM|nr:ZINC FINGER CCCH DOMAIN-CONTAINING PROTEIN 55 [Salix viminalis]KAJ6670782.1 ZINC FINGER CCCH DOMAIN-CONTAINING PROTEIN 55 [Salix viminalis]KAJ6670783.1 ZINC FINGER CCCH DOMAIN-CONTAINING PROTEIN 55 [Salix viminalis]KAJ6670784.1 ZINC FINGER CCCH DOMAIN-CONTAINING PROTEIN 55 [Salix viminalis]